FPHEPEELLLVGVRVDPDRRAPGQLPGGGGGRVGTLGDAPYDDVAVGDDAAQPVVLAADRHGTDTQVTHAPRGGEQRLVLADALASEVHDVACLGHGSPPWAGWPVPSRPPGGETRTPVVRRRPAAARPPTPWVTRP